MSHSRALMLIILLLCLEILLTSMILIGMHEFREDMQEFIYKILYPNYYPPYAYTVTDPTMLPDQQSDPTLGGLVP